MKITYEFFKEYPVTRLLIQKIMTSPFPDTATSYRMKKLVDSLSKEFDIFGELLKEKEKVIKWEDNKVANNDEVQAVFKDFYEHEFEIVDKPLNKVEISHLVNVSPREIELLEMISDPTAFDSLLGTPSP